jgi:anti-anti-sigma factor
VAGEVDLATVPELQEALDRTDEAPDPLAVDLRGVEFMDSTGLQLLLVFLGRRAGRPWTLRPSEAVKRVCDVSGVSSRLPLA